MDIGDRVRTRRFRRKPAGALGVAIIGCGYWGRNYVRVFGELPDVEVVVVCDQSLDRLQTIGHAFPNTALCTTVEAAIATPGVDAAVVCTPADTHFDVASRCVEAGLHVLVEKPMTVRSDQAVELTRMAEERGCRLLVGHTFLYNPGIAKIKEYVDTGSLGQVYYLYGERVSLGPIRDDVNAIWDLAPHDISIFSYLLGAQPDWVSAIGSCVLGRDRQDVGFITLSYPGNVLAHVHVSWVDPNKTREIVVVGSRKRAYFNDTNPLEPVRVFEKGVEPAAREADTFGEFAFLLRDGDIVSPKLAASEPLKAECQHFCDCVRHERRPLTDGHLGTGVVRVMEAIDRSLAGNGRPVAVERGDLAGGEAQPVDVPYSLR